jgi:hypothetical protein
MTSLGDFRLVAVVAACGGDNTGGLQSLIFQGENLRCDLNWLCLAMASSKTLF